MPRITLRRVGFALAAALLAPAVLSGGASGAPALSLGSISSISPASAGRLHPALGLIAPMLPAGTSATFAMSVERAEGSRYVEVVNLGATGAVSKTGGLQAKPDYSTKLKASPAGRYRARAKVVWTDAHGTARTKSSPYVDFQVPE
jgi:hypothetical protein